MRLQKRFVVFITIVQSVLFLTHLFLYKTWTFGRPQSDSIWLQVVVGLLSLSFVAASVLAFSYTNPPIRAFYRVAAVWVGLLSFLLSRRCSCLGCLRDRGTGRSALGFSCHRRIALCTGDSGRALWRLQRQLDEDHAHPGAA